MIEIHIYTTSYGFVEPTPSHVTTCDQIADVFIERAISDYVNNSRLCSGCYIAKWETDNRVKYEYVFNVRVQTTASYNVEVEP